MTELPQSVRQRLATQPLTAHPDADLLTAFAERSLPGAERQQVLAHLAQCADCRQVLALALPPLEAAAPVPVTASHGWFALPLLFRWGAAVAAVVVVSAALWLRHPQPQLPTSDAPFARIGTQPSMAPAPEAAAPAGPTSGPAPARPSVVPRVLEGANKAPHIETHAPATAEAAPASGKLAFDAMTVEIPRAKRAGHNEPAAPAAAPAAVLGGAGGSVTTRPAMDASPPPAPVAEASRYAAAEAARARAVEMQSQSERAAQSSATASTARRQSERPGDRTFAKAAPRSAAPALYFWSISADGRLQRSLDQQDWQTVNVADGISLRALARVGSYLWAAGTGGALLHSTDNGYSWQRVPIPGVASETILRLDFGTALSGSLATATSRWTTADGGRTWIKD